MEWASVTDFNYQMRKHDHEDSCLITPLSCDFLCTVFLHFAGAPFVHPLVHGMGSGKLLERVLQHRSLNIKLKLTCVHDSFRWTDSALGKRVVCSHYCSIIYNHIK